jgi:hypothetical protein
MSNLQRSFDLCTRFFKENPSFCVSSNRKTKQCENANCRNPVECNFYHDNTDKQRKICIYYLFGLCSSNTDHHKEEYKHINLPSHYNRLGSTKFLKCLSEYLETKYTPKIQKSIIRQNPNAHVQCTNDNSQPTSSISIPEQTTTTTSNRNISILNTYDRNVISSLEEYFLFKEEYIADKETMNFHNYLRYKDMTDDDIKSCENIINKIIVETSIITDYAKYFTNMSTNILINNYVDIDKCLKQTNTVIGNLDCLNHNQIIFNLYCITKIYKILVENPIRTKLLLYVYSSVYTGLLSSMNTLLIKTYMLKNNKEKLNYLNYISSLRKSFNFTDLLSDIKVLNMSYNNLKIAFSNYVIETNAKFINNTDNFSVYIKDIWSVLEYSNEFTQTLNVKPADEIQNPMQYKKVLSIISDSHNLDFNNPSIILNINRLLWNMLDPIYNCDLGIQSKDDFKLREPDQQISSFFYAKHRNRDTSKFNTVEFKSKLFNEIVYRILSNPDYTSLPAIANPVLPTGEQNCEIMKNVFDNYKTCINNKSGHIVSTIALNLINSQDFNSTVFDSLHIKGNLNNIVNMYVNSKDIKVHETQENQNKYLQNYAKTFLIKNKICDPIVLSNYKNMFYTNKNTTCITRPSMYSNHSVLSMITYE